MHVMKHRVTKVDTLSVKYCQNTNPVDSDMDDDEQESLPVFRHYTRDDLATINQLLFENKLAEKKKAEKLAKNNAVRTM